MKKKILIGIGVVVALLLLFIIALPLFFNVNQFKPQLETTLTSALGRKVEIGNISLAIFSGGVSVDNVSVGDDPAFSQSPFLQAKQLTVGMDLLPLIFSKKIAVRSFSIDEPQVSLVRSRAGVWNFSTLGSGAAKSSEKTSTSSAPDFSVDKLTISNGQISVATAGSQTKPRVYKDVNLEASNLSYTTEFPITLSATGPSGGAIKVEGKAGPINRTDTSATPLNAKINLQHADLATSGFFDPSTGIAGLLDFSATLTSDGQHMNSKGTVKTTNLKLSPKGSPSSIPVNIDYDTTYDAKAESGTLKQGDIHIGKALARLTGTYNTSGETASVQMKLNGQSMSVPDLEGVLPAVGVILPSGSRLSSGTLDANLALNGPIDKLVITGPVSLANAQLSGFSMGAKLAVLQAFTGKIGSGGSNTEIQKLSTDVRVDPGGTHASNLVLVMPSIGTVTGDANVSSTNQLDCKMVAQLAGVGGAGLSAVGSGLSALGGGKQGGGGNSNGIPFKIQGTTSNPVFIPEAGAVVGALAKGGISGVTGAGGAAGGAAGAATGALGGLLGKKKTPN
jgi:AsmA protein